MMNEGLTTKDTKRKVYPKYKPSGVEWLGEVPEHWEVKKLKYVSDTSTGFAFSSDDYTDEGIPLIRIGDILQDGNIDIENSKKLPVEYLRIYREATIRKSDILMAMTGATIGKAGQYQFEEPGLLNQRVCKFVPLIIVGKYLWFILKSEQYLEYIILTGFGGAQPNISDAQLLDFVTALPPLPEQYDIAAFLDHETSRIDSLIGKKKKLVELLTEQRTTLISRAVTKGLDAGVKLKPSGVEWLGEIPEHWGVKRLKQEFQR
jgi:type I restriction enzyme S subunit